MTHTSPDVYEEAADWYLRLKESSSDTALQQQHQQWLAQHELHRHVWSRVEKLLQTFQLPAGAIAGSSLRQARATRRNALKKMTALLIAGGSVGISWPVLRELSVFADYHTAKGERREWLLSDGSRLTLNTATAVDIRFTADLRSIFLREGEIFLQAAATGEPFIIHTPAGSIQVEKNCVMVCSNGETTRVSALDSAVAARALALPNQPVLVEAGQSLRFSPKAYEVAEGARPYADAWRQGLLVVSDWQLDRFLQELGRYHRGYIGCDASIASLSLSGSFQLNDTFAILENLATTLPIKIRYRTRYWAQFVQA